LDLTGSQLPLHLRLDCRNISKPGGRSKNLQLIPLGCCPESCPWISLGQVVDVISRDLLAGSLLHVHDLRPEIVNDVVLVVNVGDVSGLVEEIDVLGRRREVASVTRPEPVAESDKNVCSGADVVIRIAPGGDAE
jgi:hypothetical protein